MHERTPPQDIAAEQCVLGGMLLSKDAIADVVEALRGHDFYRPAHETVYDAVIDLYGRGEPADAVTVAAELTRRGELARVGGAAYLHTLIASVPTAANAGYYAKIVKERAILRRLVEAGTKIVQLGYSADGGEVDDVVDAAQAEVYAVTDRRTSEDYLPLSAIMEGALDEIEAIGSRGGEMVGVPTGFADLDALTNGMHPGQLIIVAARPAIGKALALDTALPTPTGWTTMGAVQPGDLLVGSDGRPTRVVAATDVMRDRPCYEVEFSDGSVIVADAQHQWQTTTRALAEVGQEFRNDLRSNVIRDVRPVGREFRRSNGTQRTYQHREPVYSRRALLNALADRITRPVNSWHSNSHRGVMTTAQIAETLRHRNATEERLNPAVSNSAPLDLPAADLLVAPYTLGAWLGDGHTNASKVTSETPEIPMLIEADGYVVKARGRMLYSITLPQRELVDRECDVCGHTFSPRTTHVRTCGRTCGGKIGTRPLAGCPDCGLPYAGGNRCHVCHRDHGTMTALLRKLGVLGNKHIPAAYLRASEGQRRALLAGLLDTDGHATATGSIEISLANKRLAEDVYELIVSLGYRCGRSTKDVRGRTDASSTCYRLGFTSADDVFRLPRKAIAHKERRPASTTRTSHRFITAVRDAVSVPVRCVQVEAADHLYLAGEAMIPTHNSTLGLDFARAASIRNGLASVIFSLEMSRNEITMRLLSAEARVALHHMRSGTMTDEDWNRLARRMSEVAGAPLFIDDSPHMSMMEIRAKCRRLRQRHDLRMVVVDYMQLMQSARRVESRQQEVSELSRNLKLLAKELEVPVIAISQLNRSPEQRTDKKPMLSDLRESGCMTEDTTLLRADTGAPVTFRQLLSGGHQGVLVWSFDAHRRLVTAPITSVFASGVKPVFRLRLASGREVKASGNHPFLTFEGWTPLDDLAVGDRIAVPRRTPEPIGAGLGWSEYRLGLLAHLIGDGCVPRTQPLHCTSSDETNLAFVETAAAAEFGTHNTYNPLHAWFRELGIEDLRSYEKRIPDALYSASNAELAVFLRHLWATDGSVSVPRPGSTSAHKAYYATSSRALADGVTQLLSRFGIIARVRQVTKAGYEQPGYHVIVADGTSLRVFCREIGVYGRRGEAAERLSVDAPGSDLVRAAASEDVFWDKIMEIEPLGEQPVYDATVKGTHNFIANGIAAHNSIEQDSDVVILLHREDAYEKESPRAGEADLIVAKHRNGPTSTVTVAFQGHYSRFVDMAH
ncbi:MAG: replicative DNA helicase [Carbonactinosporaceae bacterium]